MNQLELFTQKLRAHASELQNLVNRVLPIKFGRMGKDHFQNNFRVGGFVDDTTEPWQPAKRQGDPSLGAEGKYGPLLSKQNHLMSSVNYRTGNAEVTIYNDVPYADIHNSGGTTHPRVTRKMRRYAWAMFFRNGGKNGGEAADRWKALALTRKETLTVRIPQRRFLAESKQLNRKMAELIEKEIKKILDS